jgi:hypothetical protein
MNTHLRRRCDACQVRAYSLHDSPTPHPESNTDAGTPIKQKVYWSLCFLLHISFSVSQPYCYYWTNSIAGTRCSYLFPHNYMLLQTVLHHYIIVSIVTVVVSPDISKLEHTVRSIWVRRVLFSNPDPRSAPDRVSINIQQYFAGS